MKTPSYVPLLLGLIAGLVFGNSLRLKDASDRLKLIEAKLESVALKPQPEAAQPEK